MAQPSEPRPTSRLPATFSSPRGPPICRRPSPGSRSCRMPAAPGSLPRIVGAKRALALMLTADQIPADELQRMGLVYKVFDDASFRDEVDAYARRIASGPSLAYRLIKQAARVSEANDLTTQLALEAN